MTVRNEEVSQAQAREQARATRLGTRLSELDLCVLMFPKGRHAGNADPVLVFDIQSYLFMLFNPSPAQYKCIA